MKSAFKNVELAPPDPIFGLTSAFKEDQRSPKYNLGVGIYQDGEGLAQEMEVVAKVRRQIAEEGFPSSYLPMSGEPNFIQQVQQLVFQDTAALSEGRIATVQSLSGTGALRLAGEFLHRQLGMTAIALSDPTWSNHYGIFGDARLETPTYAYYDAELKAANVQALLRSLEQLPENTAVCLHACCHNPTGADLSAEEWTSVADVCEAREILPLFDFAYQGFASGLYEDAAPIRIFCERGIPFLVAQSFSKSMSLYNRRTGHLSVVCSSANEAQAVASQLKLIARKMYSNPPIDGALIVARILSQSALRTEWEQELASMRERIQHMRAAFIEGLKSEGVNQDFSFLLEQRGMFSYSGLTKEQVARLKEQHAIYSVGSGRICVAAMNSHNIDYIAKAVADVLRHAE